MNITKAEFEMLKPKFSICIPNFNYKEYLELTCKSILLQDFKNYEIIIADNQSTDGSIEFIHDFACQYPKVTYIVNPTNLGFAGNLDKVTSLARGEYFILLSSDDLMNLECLNYYDRLIACIDGKKSVIGSSVVRIDESGNPIEQPKPNAEFWQESDRDEILSNDLQCTVYKVAASEMLHRSISLMGNPYYFLTVCYSSSLYEKVGGYGGGRMYSPDKWFNWKLFSEADFVYLIDKPLFSYRWHSQNQLSLESSKGHLKFLVDEYRNVMEITNQMLNKAGLQREEFEINFIKRDIYRHGIGEFVKGRWLKSLRIFFFGFATFPGRMILNPFLLLYTVALITTPLGSKLISFLLKKK